MKPFILTSLSAIMLIATACDDSSADLDKQVSISFNSANWTTTSTTWEMTPASTHLIKFNKDYYADLSSIVFVATLAVQDGDENNTCSVKLYNVTDGTDITTTDLTSTSRTLEWKESENIIDKLPSKEIEIAIMLKSSDGSGWVQVSTPSLMLYRK
ncbi:hypothetical protein [Ohtaekwangia sp.]|uniref:hypothetical protein n=1 Tax=Ohtaekwangia sp. TaxID=2066019 RepID=UPI002FDED9F1